MNLLGDDRVRLYGTDGTGQFEAIAEVALPENTKPLGITSPRNISGYAPLVVAVQDQANPTARILLVGDQQIRYEGLAVSSDAHLFVGYFGGNEDYDVAIIEGKTIRVIMDVIDFIGE